MENTSKRRDSLQNQRPEQSIADEDTSVSHPLRVQQQNQSDRQGDVAIESYGGVSPTMSYEKDQPRFNRAIDPQYKFREIYANAQSKPQSKTRKPPEKQYSWIERMNHSVEKVQDKDKGGDANDGLVDKFIDFLNGLGEQPEESHPKDAGYIAQQHGVEFEPSEATYDTAQANNATRGDDTTQDEPTMLASRSSGPISSYKTADMSEFDMSDGQYDNFQQTERLDDNARRNSWSKPSGQQQSGSMQSQSIAFSTQKLPDISMSKSAPSRSHRSSFGTRRNDPYHIQEHPYYPGSASPNWAAGTFAPLETSIPKSRKLSGRHGPDDTPSAHNGRKRSRQESIETLKPSSYLSIPPMIPSEMSLEALLHPSKQVDLLQFDDLGIDTLFDQTINLSDYLSMPPMAPSELSMEALRNPSKQVDLLQFDDLGIDKLFDKTVRPSTYLGIPPMTPSELSMEALRNPSKQVDLLQYDDLGIDKLFDKTVRPSTYLGIPPMIPSELSMEALRNPSKQVDLLQFDDLGIDRLFDQTITPSTYLSILPMAPSKLAMEALRHPSKLFDLLKFDDLGIDKLFGQTIKTSDDLSIPPMVPSELSMEAFRHPSKQVDLLQFDDLGIDTLFDETIKPSDYLSIPPMAPSELSMEPLHHPSKQVDLLQFDDLGIDKLFWTPLATAGKSDLQNIAQKLSQEAAPNYNISKIKPPAVPSSLALECLFNPNPSSADWAWGVDDIGLKDLMSHERTLSHSRTLNEKMNRTHKVDQRPKKTSAVHEATGYQDSLDKIMNRTHKVDQRPKMTSALHEQTDYQSFCIPVVDPRPHALGLSQSSIFDSQDVTGDFDITQSTTGRVHATIQRPKAFQKDERRMGAKSTMVELPPEIYVRDSWSSYMAFKTSQEQPKQHLRYESPGSLARDKFEGQGEGRSQQPSLVQSTLVDVNEAVEQRKRRKREMRAENRKKDWADNMDDSQFETLFPAQFEGSADNVPQSKRSVTDTQHQVAEEPQVPTWTSTSSYGINAPYSLPPFSFESNARETAYPTDEEESKDWKSQNKNKFTMPATTPLHGVKADKDSESQDPQLQMNYKLHGLVDTVASGVGAVAGTAVGALSYWFSDSSHSTEEKPKQSSFSSNTAVNAGDQLYANETEGVQAISVVPDSHLTGAEEQLFMAKKDNPNLALGHVDDDTHVVNLHPSLLRPSERAELSTDQSLGSPGHNGNPSIGPQSELPRSLQYETGRTTKDRDLSSKYASQNIGGGTNADKNEPASDDEIRKLFNGDPDTVRQPFKTNQPHKTTMDDRRQIWEASMSTALGQAATTLGLQPQSKEKTLDLENYHVVNSGYKPSSYEPGRNQFDSDFENWKHDYPTRTSFNEGERKQNEGAQEHASDQAGNADNGQSDDSAQNVTNSSSQISGVPAWERAEFHDPSDYMKDTKSHTQHRHSRQPDPTTASSHHGRGPTGWIRRKLNKRHVRAER